MAVRLRCVRRLAELEVVRRCLCSGRGQEQGPDLRRWPGARSRVLHQAWRRLDPLELESLDTKPGQDADRRVLPETSALQRLRAHRALLFDILHHRQSADRHLHLGRCRTNRTGHTRFGWRLRRAGARGAYRRAAQRPRLSPGEVRPLRRSQQSRHLRGLAEGAKEMTTISRPAIRRLWHPLTAILAVQTSLSLTLIWSNTAYIDEADYLWVGHLALGGWLHGTPWPASLTRTMLSGSPVIYPPIGALADDVAGLAGARILSMLFMLAATVLLYSAASKIIGRDGAVIAAALWAVSEPALRLAYATYDPLSVFMTTVCAWLIVQTAHRRHRIVLAALSVVMLALANAMAYS